MVEARRATFLAELPVPLALRRERLRRAAALVARDAPLFAAALVDDGRHAGVAAAYDAEIAPAQATLDDALLQLARWMRPTLAGGWLARHRRDAGRIVPQPRGVVGIAVPPAAPFAAAVTLLAGALAAGNRVVLGFDRADAHLARRFAARAAGLFDPSELAVLGDAPGDAERFAAMAFDARLDAQPAPAEAPEPALAPAIVTRGVALARVAEQLVDARLRGGGTAPDLILVPEEALDPFAAWLWRAAMRPDSRRRAAASPPPAPPHREQLARLLDDARARGAMVRIAAPDRPSAGAGLPLHLVTHVGTDMALLTPAAAGIAPLLSVMAYRTLDSAFAVLDRMPVPRALACFGRDPGEARRVLARTRSAAFAFDAWPTALGDRGAAATLPPPESAVEHAFRRSSRLRHVLGAPRLTLPWPRTPADRPAPQPAPTPDPLAHPAL